MTPKSAKPRATRAARATSRKPRATDATRAESATLVVHPLTAERWDDVVRLFGPRGACAGCWCMYPRRTRTQKATSGEPNRRAFRKLVHDGPPPGLLAYEGDVPVGWVAIAPRTEYVRFERSRVLKAVDDQPVWSVPCFFIARTHRGRGVTVALLEAACAWARTQGARIVEGYPIDAHGQTYAPAFAWHGLVPTFTAAGFREVLRRSDRRPIMRRELAAAPRGRRG